MTADDDLKKLSEDIRKLVHDYLTSVEHRGEKYTFSVACVLLKHAELMFCSLEDNYEIAPERMEIAKRELVKHYRETYARSTTLNKDHD